MLNVVRTIGWTITLASQTFVSRSVFVVYAIDGGTRLAGFLADGCYTRTARKCGSKVPNIDAPICEELKCVGKTISRCLKESVSDRKTVNYAIEKNLE